jgi:hypothetical protein
MASAIIGSGSYALHGRDQEQIQVLAELMRQGARQGFDWRTEYQSIYFVWAERRPLLPPLGEMERLVGFICPVPDVWAAAHQRLLRAWKRAGKVASEPPIPLILNGWAFSSDAEKADRWTVTVKWAERHGHSHLIPTMREREHIGLATPAAASQVRARTVQSRCCEDGQG